MAALSWNHLVSLLVLHSTGSHSRCFTWCSPTHPSEISISSSYESSDLSEESSPSETLICWCSTFISWHLHLLIFLIQQTEHNKKIMAWLWIKIFLIIISGLIYLHQIWYSNRPSNYILKIDFACCEGITRTWGTTCAWNFVSSLNALCYTTVQNFNEIHEDLRCRDTDLWCIIEPYMQF